MTVEFSLNRKRVAVEIERPGTTLMDYLRGHGIYSVKYGSDRGEAGADTVLIDGQALNASLVLLFTLDGKQVETIESLDQAGGLDPIQAAFIAEGAIQCGYCTPGMILSLEALRREPARPTEADIRDALTGNLCRCTGYVKPVQAALKALQGLPEDAG